MPLQAVTGMLFLTCTFNALLSHRNRQFCEGSVLCIISTMFSAKSASSVNVDHHCNKTDIYRLDFVIGWLVKRRLKIKRYNLTVPFLTMNSTDDHRIETHWYTFCNL